MHDPDVMVFTLHLPIPGHRYSFPTRQPDGLRRRRYTGSSDDGGIHSGDPMGPWWRPEAWTLVVRGREVKMMELVDVWHEEPDGHDSGTVCKGMGGSDLTWHNIKWAVAHRGHLRLRWQTPLRTLHRWYTERCSDCGRRFGYHEGRQGYWGGDEVFHNNCQSLRHAHAWINDLERALTGEQMDSTEQWRLGYRLKRELAWWPDGRLAMVAERAPEDT